MRLTGWDERQRVRGKRGDIYSCNGHPDRLRFFSNWITVLAMCFLAVFPADL